MKNNIEIIDLNTAPLTIEELEKNLNMLIEAGGEINENRSAYDSKEEWKTELQEIDSEIKTIEATINSQEATMKNNNCHAITNAGEKCKGKYCTISGFVLTLNGQAVHESLVNPDNMPGWFRIEVPFCSKHTDMLKAGRKIKIQSLRDASKVTQPSLPGIPKKVDSKKKEISCAHCSKKHATIDQVKACSGIAMKRTKAPISIKTNKVTCGNCRKKGVEDPRHDTPAQVKACYLGK